MASSLPSVDAAWLRSVKESLELAPSTAVLGLALLVILPMVAGSFLGVGGPVKSKYPVANPSTKMFQLAMQRRLDFIRHGIEYLREGRRRFAGEPFVLMAHDGPVTVLPQSKAHDIRNHPDLDLRTRAIEIIYPFLPGFEPFKLFAHPDAIIQNMTKKHLTKRLNTITEPLANETSYATSVVFGGQVGDDWKEGKIYDMVLDLVARLSSRVFLGTELCRNEEWLFITKNYTVSSNMGSMAMRMFPKILRPLVYLVEPSCRATRQLSSRARRLVAGVVAKRRQERAEHAAATAAAGEGGAPPPPAYNDALEWAEAEAAGQPYSESDVQLFLSFAAIHTTSDLMAQTLLHLASAPENIDLLRKEMVEVLGAAGWTKTSLYKLKLLDSAVKEAQRLKPISSGAMTRKALKKVELPDGTVLNKGENMIVDNYSLMDPAIHPDPERYDMGRFLRIREQPGGEHKAQLVTTNPENLAFGYGRHACPGRFFAANEIKVALCHALLKYDWAVCEGTTTEPLVFGIESLSVNPETRLKFRPRTPEIDLDALEVERGEE